MMMMMMMLLLLLLLLLLLSSHEKSKYTALAENDLCTFFCHERLLVLRLQESFDFMDIIILKNP